MTGDGPTLALLPCCPVASFAKGPQPVAHAGGVERYRSGRILLVSNATLFVLIFVGLFVLRIVLATVFFALVLPAGDQCPNCDTATLRIQSRVFGRWLPWFRRSWCLACGWTGVLRHGVLSAQDVPIEAVTRR